MGLDDTCCDFVSLYAQKRQTLAQSVDGLLESIEFDQQHYPSDEGSQLDAMRRAAERVQRLLRSQSDWQDRVVFPGAVLWLLKLVDFVGVNRVFGSEGYDAVEKWCADWLRELEHVENDRCPRCGATEKVEEALDEILNRAKDYFDGRDSKRDCAINIARLT